MMFDARRLLSEIILRAMSRAPITIWPASREKGPSDITHNVDQDQPQNDVENTSM